MDRAATSESFEPPSSDLPGALWHDPAVRRLLLVSVLGFTGFAATVAALPAWLVDTGTSLAAAGSATAVLLAATVAVQLAVPGLVRRSGADRALALGLVLLGAPPVLHLLSDRLGPVLAVSALRGTGFAVLTVVGAALAGQLAPARRRGESIGLYGLAVAVPNLLVVPTSVALVQAHGVLPVVLLASAPLLAVPIALRLPRGADAVAGGRTPGEPEPSRGGWVAVRAAAAPSLVLLTVTLAAGGVLTYLPIERPDGAVAAAGLLVLGLLGAVARWRVGTVADRIGTRVLLPVAVASAAAGLLMIAAGLAGPSSSASRTAVLLLGTGLLGAGYGAVQNLTLVVAFSRAGPCGTSTASAVWNAGFDTGTALGALVVGALAGAGLGVPWAMAVSAAAAAASLSVAVRLR